MSLLDMPTLVLHRIFDNLDMQSILLSIRLVCRALYNASDCYDRFKLDFDLRGEAQLKIISRIMRPQCITSLNHSRRCKWNYINIFLSHFKLSECTRLRQVTVCDVTPNGLKYYLDRMTNNHIYTLRVDFQIGSETNQASIDSLSSFITQSKLKILNLNYNGNMSRFLSLPAGCALSQLTISNCTCNEYRTILHRCPDLEKLIINGYLIGDDDDYQMLHMFTKTDSIKLTSLTIKNCQLPIVRLISLLSLTPSLTHLTLVSSTSSLASYFDGSFWMNFITKKLLWLSDFRFYFVCHQNISYKHEKISSIINSFRKPFWLHEKRWFVTLDYSLDATEFKVYTSTFHETNDKAIIRREALSNDDTIHILTRRCLKDENDDVTTGVSTILSSN